MSGDYAKDHAATAAMMAAVAGHDVEEVLAAATTMVAQCCLMGADTIAEAYEALDAVVAQIKTEMTDNADHIGGFPRRS